MATGRDSISAAGAGAPAKSPGAGGSLFAGGLAAVAGSVCCVGPVTLFLLGVSGAWVGSLTALQPYQPIFIALTALFLGLAFRRLYLVKPVCADGSCAAPTSLRTQRIILWIVTALAFGLLAFPWYGPWLLA